MSKREPSILLNDIIRSGDKVSRYTKGLTKEAFLKDEKTLDAVIRNLEIIGEAVRQLPAEFKDRHRGAEWNQIAGMRNRIVHDYAGLDFDLIWEVIQSDLLDFIAFVKSIA